ncbi:TPA: pentapeptide repeat-containing protein [Yersinia enterocolitica]|nr:pentapeptide repeat-containing protein [Yersinia enterocolitica]HDL7781618.1 pentapeptide repeat-containing protein [Yersinia enterocolitica]
MSKCWYKIWWEHPLRNIIVTFILYFIIVVLWSITFPWFSTWFFPKTEFGIYNKGFWNDLLVNLNASSFDFLVFGVILFFFEKRRERNGSNKDLLNNLIDISKYNSPEINLKKIGILRRLNEAGVYEIKIHRMNISGSELNVTPTFDKSKVIEIRDITFKDSDLTGLVLKNIYLTKSNFINTALQAINLEGSKLRNVTFDDCIMKNAVFENTKFHGVTLSACNLSKANFRNGEFKNCMFKLSDMGGVVFDGANMNRANIRGVTNLNVDDLCKSENLDYIIADDDVISRVKTLRRDVKFSR